MIGLFSLARNGGRLFATALQFYLRDIVRVTKMVINVNVVNHRVELRQVLSQEHKRAHEIQISLEQKALTNDFKVNFETVKECLSSSVIENIEENLEAMKLSISAQKYCQHHLRSKIDHCNIDLSYSLTLLHQGLEVIATFIISHLQLARALIDIVTTDQQNRLERGDIRFGGTAQILSLIYEHLISLLGFQ
eukprot:Awhi_evm1s5975